MTRGGLPHSDIFGSKLVCSSPKLFAACHVLHRLLAPRHSPYTLSSLTIRNSKLTRTHRLHADGSCDSSMQHCFSTSRRSNVVVGKNYRLQNIQLSKIRPGELVPRTLRWILGTRSPGPPRSLTRGAPMPRSARSRGAKFLLTSAADRTRRCS